MMNNPSQSTPLFSNLTKRIGLSLCLALLMGSLQAQELSFEQAKHLFGPQRVLTFRQFSLDLTDKSKTELQTLSALIRQYPGIIATHLLVIQIFSCEKELTVKPYLGVCRGQVIVDYLEKELGLSRKKCLIRDGGVNSFDPTCATGSGTYLYLRPSWTE